MEMSEQTLGKLPQTEIIFGKLLSRLEKEANNQGQSNQELRGQVQETRSKTHEVTYITSSAVGPGYLVRENLKTLSAPAQTDKALTRRGDIVIKLTKPFDSALVRTQQERSPQPRACLYVQYWCHVPCRPHTLRNRFWVEPRCTQPPTPTDRLGGCQPLPLPTQAIR